MLVSSVIQALEYDKLLEVLKGYTASRLGLSRVESLVPSTDIGEVRYLQALCSEARFFSEVYGGIPLSGLRDISHSLVHAGKVGSILEAEELLAIRKVAALPSEIHGAFDNRDREEFPYLFSLVDGLPMFPELVESIGYCLDSEGYMLDRASPALRGYRRRLHQLRENIHAKLESVLRSPEHRKLIQEPVITSRNNRYVIPIKQESRSSFRGVVQGQSTSGATFFVEPLDVVQMNNALHEVAELAQREVRRILGELTDRVRAELDALVLAVEVLGELDFLNAKARLSLALSCVEPKLNESGTIKLVEARHPLLECHVRDAAGDADVPERVVPTNVHIGESFNTLVITGPNTGGKTVVLKTVGLLVLMAQSGLHVPADLGSELGVFDYVFADIGDDQGIEQSLSTFSSHITKIADMLARVGEAGRSLVLLDEIGAGTDPSEGAALGMALLDWLSGCDVRTVVTTHYGALKAYADGQGRMENASMEFDWTTLRPTYRLQVGVPGSSNAIKIASQLGIPMDILSAAESYLGANAVAVEDLLVRLQEKELELERGLGALQERESALAESAGVHERAVATFARERAAMKTAAESEATQIVGEARRTVERLVANIRKEQASTESIKRAKSEIAAKAKESLNGSGRRAGDTGKVSRGAKVKRNGARSAVERVAVGDKVRVRSLQQFGEVVGVKARGKKPVQVSVGRMQVQISYQDIESVAPKVESSGVSTSVLDIQYTKANTVQSELNLHGFRVLEALDETDKYIDDACLAGLPSVRISHGKGTGAVRDAVRNLLKDHPLVAKYEFAQHHEGGEGVTVVTF